METKHLLNHGYSVLIYALIVFFIGCKKDQTEITKPIAAFTTDHQVIEKGGTVNFMDKSSNTPTNWLWDFGDGETSTSQNPSHVFEITGTFKVTLTVENEAGSDVESKTDYIQTFETIKIGTQRWMLGNINYNSGSLDDWYLYAFPSDTNPRRLYNGEAANNICPSGWHLPSDLEWNVLIDYLGGEEVAGGKMKEVGTAHWSYPNSGATNSSGFTALPGGVFQMGSYDQQGDNGYYWSSTEINSDEAIYRCLTHTSSKVIRDTCDKKIFFSVRCVKNN